MEGTDYSLDQFKEMLEEWAQNISKSTEESIRLALEKVVGTTPSPEVLSEKQKLIGVIQDAHDKQIETLRAAISDERKQSAQAQMVKSLFLLFFSLFSIDLLFSVYLVYLFSCLSRL